MPINEIELTPFVNANNEPAAEDRSRHVTGYRYCVRRKRCNGRRVDIWQDEAIPIARGEVFDKTWLAQFPLSTRGRHIVNMHGERFYLKGVNWYGASDCYHVVGGLDVQKLDVICQSIRTLGFTVVRLPFSNEMLRSRVLSSAINYDLNPALRGLSALEVLDEVVLSLGRHNTAIILNNHTTYGEWCGPPGRNGLWFDPGSTQTEEQWIEDWVMLAKRYSNCPHVVGYDLRNEIRSCFRNCRVSWPAWGSSASSRFFGCCDWASAAMIASRRLLEIQPGTLIVVERIVWPQRGLQAYIQNPGPLFPHFNGRIVLGVHHYSWSGPGRFIPKWAISKRLHCILSFFCIITKRNYGDVNADEIDRLLSREWGFVLDAGICPVWVSEFGANSDDPQEMRWLAMFCAFLKKTNADWAYWPLNVGPKPGSGEGEPYGMLNDDWTVRTDDCRLELLQSIGLQNAAWGPLSRDQEELEHMQPSPLNGAALLNSTMEQLDRESLTTTKVALPASTQSENAEAPTIVGATSR